MTADPPEAVLEGCLQAFGADPGCPSKLNSYHNHVYEYRVQGRPCILRIGRGRRRRPEEVAAEVAFVQYLRSHGAPVCEFLPSTSGRFVESVAWQHQRFLAVTMAKAEGREWFEAQHSSSTYTALGRALGTIHALSHGFRRQQTTVDRRSWRDLDYLLMAPEVAGPDRSYLLHAVDQLTGALAELPEDDAGFGLVHGDFLFGNCRYHGDCVTVYDFDDCHLNWFLYDIAVCMFYYILGGEPREVETDPEAKRDYSCTQFASLWSGYRQESDLSEAWLEHMPLFMRLREIELVVSILSRSAGGELSGWQASFVETAERRIRDDRPLLALDYRGAASVRP